MKITYFIQNEGGCDYYRAILPLETLKKKLNWDIRKRTPINLVTDGEINPNRFHDDMGADIIFLPRVTCLTFFNKIKVYVRDYNPNGKIVIDHDDNVFNISPMSPHYADFGTEPAKIKFSDGTYKDLWYDGMEFNSGKISFRANKERLEDVKASLSEADLTTTTTQKLASVLNQYSKQIRILPNCIDSHRWRKLPLIKKQDEVRLFWAGGDSHYEDWFQIKGAIREIMNKYRNAKLVLMGCIWPRTLDGIEKERIEFYEWEHTMAYPYRMASLGVDIGLIPLHDTEFNRCKSPIKWIEMAALSIPSVTSCIPPYKQMMCLGQDNGVFIRQNDPKAWVDGISYLIDNEMERKMMGQRAYQTVMDHFDIHTQYNLWSDALQEVAYGSSVKSEPCRNSC